MEELHDSKRDQELAAMAGGEKIGSKELDLARKLRKQAGGEA